MKACYFALLPQPLPSRRVGHYYGLPPELTEGVDTRTKMPDPRFVILYEAEEGAFVFRYTQSGECVGDTWHACIEDAKHQVHFEYSLSPEEWCEFPADVEDPVQFVRGRMLTSGEESD